MNTQLTRSFFDACHLAKRIITRLPSLPDWMTPRQVATIDAIHQLQKAQQFVRPSDVANYLNGTQPSVTRMLSELEKHGVLKRTPSSNDKRSHDLTLTAYGESLYNNYVERFHTHVAELFVEIDEDALRTAVTVIEQAWALLKDDEFSITSISKEV